MESLLQKVQWSGKICRPIGHLYREMVNENRGGFKCSDFALALAREARVLCRNGEFYIDLNPFVYTLDSTTIKLCLSFFLGQN